MKLRPLPIIALLTLPLLAIGCLQGSGPAGDVGNAALRAGSPINALIAAGQRYLDAEEPNDAFIVFRRAAQRDGSSYEAQLGLAKACLELGETTLGLNAAGAAARLKPEASEPLFTAGRICLTTNKLEKAEEYLKEGLALDNTQAEAWGDLGEARLRQGSLEGATAALEKARALDGKSADIHAKLGTVYAAAERYEEATEEYTRAVTLDPANAIYPRSLAWLLIKQNKGLDQARELALKSDQLDRGDGDALLAAAVALLQQGYVDDALTELQDAVDKVGTNADIYIFLAEAAVQRGTRDDYETAVKALEYVRAMGLQPRRTSQEDVASIVEAIKDGISRYGLDGS